MTKKRINSTALIEELKGGSVFFRPSETKPTDEPQSAAVPVIQEQSAEKKHSPAPDTPEPQQQPAPLADPYARTPVRTNVRTITRYAYEIYRDQVDAIHQLAFEDKLRGSKISMSEMVREALDDYIAKRRKSHT